MVRDNKDVAILVSCWQVILLPDLEVVEKGLEFATKKKNMYFLNLKVESNASNIVLTLNAHQQSPIFIGYTIGDCINFNICL